jgi:outer membrane biosynthesis protein TonB
MKKLAFALLASAALVTPALACPNSDHDAPRTADQKEAPKADKAKETPKSDAKPTDTAKKDSKDSKPTAAPAKDSKDTAKKPDKVSSK